LKRWRWWIILLLFLGGCVPKTAKTPAVPTAETGEMRGVWVTYTELDALLADKTPADAQKAIDGLMRACADAGLNTVFFHARANADAYYASGVFPPASGARALLKAGFDPLSCAVEAAHKRGLRLHAWINPYRVGKTDPGIKDTFSFEDGVWYAPHSAAAQKRIVDGVREIVDKYAVDGVQFDDYFYPVGAVPNDRPADFEKAAYAAYCKERGDGALTVADWRREGVSALLKQVYSACHRRAGCVFGVSPSHDADKNRKEMYADVAAWMNTPGMVDYVCPQIYFGFDHETCPFHQTAARWLAMPRRDGVALYAGLALYKAGQEDPYAGSGKEEWKTRSDIIARSIRWLRTRKGIGGFCLFSFGHLTRAAAETAALKKVLR
jgi:uncharacterized lipoprotein YddW (UPF0748 family)